MNAVLSFHARPKNKSPLGDDRQKPCSTWRKRISKTKSSRSPKRKGRRAASYGAEAAPKVKDN